MNDKRWLFACVVLMIFLVAGFDCLAGQKPGADDSAKMSMSKSSAADQTVNPVKPVRQPKSLANAVIVEPIFAFKPVLDGKVVTHAFTIKNTGMDELKILKVRTG